MKQCLLIVTFLYFLSFLRLLEATVAASHEVNCSLDFEIRTKNDTIGSEENITEDTMENRPPPVAYMNMKHPYPIGTRVYKEFPSYGWFWGTVTSHFRELKKKSHNNNDSCGFGTEYYEYYYEVIYTDGDEETLDQNKIEAFLNYAIDEEEKERNQRKEKEILDIEAPTPSRFTSTTATSTTTTRSTTCISISNSPPETHNDSDVEIGIEGESSNELLLESSDNVDVIDVANIASQCAANRAARMAKLRTKQRTFMVPSKRKQSGRGRKRNELQIWQDHQQQLRNRQTAAACYERRKLYMKELELQILDYKLKYEQLQHVINVLEEAER